MKLYIHTPTGQIFTVSKEVMEEILRVAIEQKDVIWPMSCYEDARRLQSFVREQ